MARSPYAACRRRAVLFAAGAAALAALAPASLPAMPRGAGGFTLVIKDVRSPDGQVHVGVFNDAEAFPRGDSVAGARVDARSGRVVVRFPDLPAGRYALAFYHDENGNGEFDKTLLGLPEEGFGFSNDAPLRLGPPAFDDAAVDFDGISLTHIATMLYF
jgi:uncharacterized protein (DUF2141 family)